MCTNVLKAIININSKKSYRVSSNYNSKNRMNTMGASFEYFIKDAFCNSFEDSFEIKNKKYADYFSYLGNQNNPPDVIIKKGDAIEIKKLENKITDIVLNSSYPKSKLFSDSPMITSECKNCEEWTSKDLLYIVGNIKENEIVTLFFIYGDCYAADKEIYEDIRSKVIENINTTNLEYSETKELGRINKVDPLGITNLRIRGMWTIQHPLKVYSELLKITVANFQLFVLMKQDKYLSFPREDRENIESNKEIILEEVSIPNPNNPAKLISCKMITVIK